MEQCLRGLRMRRTGSFHNTRRLDQTSIDTIVAWVNRGAPQGNPADLPSPPIYADGWSIGTPDAVFSLLEPFAVPAEGVVDYQLFDVLQARRSWLTKSDVLNTLPPPAFADAMKKR